MSRQVGPPSRRSPRLQGYDWRQIPLHAHGVRAGDVACNVTTGVAGSGGSNDKRFSRISPRASSLGAVVRSFKSAVTKAAHEAYVCRPGPFWEQRYYDRIIRSPRERFLVERYIELNPLLWQVKHSISLSEAPDLPSLRRRLRRDVGLSEFESAWVLHAGGPGNHPVEE